MNFSRRDCLRYFTASAGASLAATLIERSYAQDTPLNRLSRSARDLTIKEFRVTPIALPDPPLLAASGCHGPYYLRNVIELRTDAGVVGLGETHGGEGATASLEAARAVVTGRDAFAFRAFARELRALGESCYAGIELACLDA